MDEQTFYKQKCIICLLKQEHVIELLGKLAASGCATEIK